MRPSCTTAMRWARIAGREAVGDEDRGAALEQHVERSLDPRLGAQVEVRRRLVEHEHAAAGRGTRVRGRAAAARQMRATRRARGPACRARRAAAPADPRARPPRRLRASRRQRRRAAANETLSRIEPANRNASCGTVPTCWRSDCSVDVAHVVSVEEHAAARSRRRGGSRAWRSWTCPRRSRRRTRTSPRRDARSTSRSTGMPGSYSNETCSSTIDVYCPKALARSQLACPRRRSRRTRLAGRSG